MIFLLAYAPDAAKPASADMGTAAALLVILALTCWPWMGYMTKLG